MPIVRTEWDDDFFCAFFTKDTVHVRFDVADAVRVFLIKMVRLFVFSSGGI